MKCRKCGSHHYAELTIVGRACDNCGDEHKEVKEKGYVELERENNNLRAELDMTMSEQEQLLSEIAELKKLVEQMGDFYIEHKPHCEKAMFVNGQCSCGLEEIKAAIRAAKG